MREEERKGGERSGEQSGASPRRRCLGPAPRSRRRLRAAPPPPAGRGGRGARPGTGTGTGAGSGLGAEAARGGPVRRRPFVPQGSRRAAGPSRGAPGPQRPAVLRRVSSEVHMKKWTEIKQLKFSRRTF